MAAEVIELAKREPFQGGRQALRLTAQRLTRGKNRGAYRCNIRTWFYGDDGELRPTRRGWQFGAPDEMALLLSILIDGLREAHAREMISATTLLKHGVDPTLLLLKQESENDV